MAETEASIIEEWDESHARWPEFVQALQETAPEQAPFVLGDYSRHLKCYLFVALRDGAVAGFLRFGIQPIGPEWNCPPLTLDGEELTEAKINAFAVREEHRCRGLGTALQQYAIRRARELGCYQLSSHSSYGREANYHVKLSLGFAAHPSIGGDGKRAVHFIMPLRASTANMNK